MERLKFDPRPYTSELDAEKLAVNLADIAIEARVGPVRERINPYTLVVTQDGRVINPQLGEEDIVSLYRTETPLDIKETQAAVKIREALLYDPVGSVAVWFSPASPSYGYMEGRITVGYTRLENGVKDMQSYGIPVVDTTPVELLYQAWRLAEFSNRQYILNNPEDLRSEPIVFLLPDQENPWEFLSRYLPYPDVWEAIISNDAQVLKEKALDVARQVSPTVLNKILVSKTFNEKVSAIEYGIVGMGDLGMMIDMDKLVCPINAPSMTSSYYSVSSGDGGTKVEGEHKFVRNCGQCGKPIHDFIPKGYRCSCGGVYEGC
jgi:hypothetical protein